ncbi:hypothetical protein R3P38DRAFT_2801033 [Favolaschia claudopus]|uniref:Uncharacterized protein n=1 Tax=Favolaschia claudopus TaxID=2862362 RepID=A0AAV9ZVR9_9AGAR
MPSTFAVRPAASKRLTGWGKQDKCPKKKGCGRRQILSRTCWGIKNVRTHRDEASNHSSHNPSIGYLRAITAGAARKGLDAKVQSEAHALERTESSSFPLRRQRRWMETAERTQRATKEVDPATRSPLPQSCVSQPSITTTLPSFVDDPSSLLFAHSIRSPCLAPSTPARTSPSTMYTRFGLEENEDDERIDSGNSILRAHGRAARARKRTATTPSGEDIREKDQSMCRMAKPSRPSPWGREMCLRAQTTTVGGREGVGVVYTQGRVIKDDNGRSIPYCCQSGTTVGGTGGRAGWRVGERGEARREACGPPVYERPGFPTHTREWLRIESIRAERSIDESREHTAALNGETTVQRKPEDRTEGLSEGAAGGVRAKKIEK